MRYDSWIQAMIRVARGIWRIAKPQLIIVSACVFLFWEGLAEITTRRTRHKAVGANATFQIGGDILAWPAQKGRRWLGGRFRREYPGAYPAWQELFKERKGRKRRRRRR